MKESSRILGKRFLQRCSPPPPGHFAESMPPEEKLPGQGVIFNLLHQPEAASQPKVTESPTLSAVA